MADKAVLTGQFAMVDEVNSNNIFTFDLAERFPPITGLGEHSKLKQDIIVGDGIVTLDLGGVATIKGILLFISGGGEIILKHDSNTNGIQIDSGMILFGKIADITIETTSTTTLKVEYVVFE